MQIVFRGCVPILAAGVEVLDSSHLGTTRLRLLEPAIPWLYPDENGDYDNNERYQP
jgi:hypothetical protein